MHTKDMDKNVHSSGICHIPNLAVAQLPINSRIYGKYDMFIKQNMT